MGTDSESDVPIRRVPPGHDKGAETHRYHIPDRIKHRERRRHQVDAMSIDDYCVIASAGTSDLRTMDADGIVDPVPALPSPKWPLWGLWRYNPEYDPACEAIDDDE